MKLLHSTILALAIGSATISSAYARDSFSLVVNIGGYAVPVAYYSAPRVVYYDTPTVYYRSAPQLYYQPLVSHRYFDDGRRGYSRGWDHDGWRREALEHHGWGHGERGRQEGHH
jgi:hypothetical protein